MNYQKEYNRLSKEEKESFIEFHAPEKLAVNRVLARKFRAIYESHLGKWRMPTKAEMKHYHEMENAKSDTLIKNYKNFRYDAIPKKLAQKILAEVEAGKSEGSKRGTYTDLENNTHRGFVLLGNFYLQIVEDLQKEQEFLDTLIVKSVAPPAAIVEEEKEEDLTDEEKAIYEKYLDDKQRLSKKEFAQENNISTYTLNKIIKANEV